MDRLMKELYMNTLSQFVEWPKVVYVIASDQNLCVHKFTVSYNIVLIRLTLLITVEPR